MFFWCRTFITRFLFFAFLFCRTFLHRFLVPIIHAFPILFFHIIQDCNICFCFLGTRSEDDRTHRQFSVFYFKFLVMNCYRTKLQQKIAFTKKSSLNHFIPIFVYLLVFKQRFQCIPCVHTESTMPCEFRHFIDNLWQGQIWFRVKVVCIHKDTRSHKDLTEGICVSSTNLHNQANKPSNPFFVIQECIKFSLQVSTFHRLGYMCCNLDSYNIKKFPDFVFFHPLPCTLGPLDKQNFVEVSFQPLYLCSKER